MKWLLLGLLLLAAGCSSALGPLRVAWNGVNAEAVDLEIAIGEAHQAELDAIIEDGSRTQEEKLAAVDVVAEKYEPAYAEHRALRATLATTRVALKAAELAEESGDELDVAKIAALIQDLVAAVQTVEGAIP